MASRQSIAENAASIIADYEDRIDVLFGDLSTASHHTDLDAFRWFFAGIFVLNQGIRRALNNTGRDFSIEPPEKPDGGKWFFLPRLADTSIPVELGCNSDEWLDGDAPSGYTRYWNSDYAFVNPGRSRSGLMAVLKTLLTAHPTPVAATDLEEEALAAALELEYVTISDGEIHLAIPVFTSEDGEKIAALADDISTDIAKRPLEMYPKDVYEIFDKLGFGFTKENYIVRAHNLACPGAMRSLVSRRFLSPPKDDRSDSWGVFFWMGEFLPMASE